MSFDVNLLVTVIGSRVSGCCLAYLSVHTPCVFFDFVWRRPACLIRLARIERTDVFIGRAHQLLGGLAWRYGPSYVYEIYYCSISSGSQKICRNRLNVCLQVIDFKNQNQKFLRDLHGFSCLYSSLKQEFSRPKHHPARAFARGAAP